MDAPTPVDISLRRGGDLKAISHEVRGHIFRWMLETRPEKFKKFIRCIKLFRYAICSCVRGDLLESFYAALRFCDDIADGDHPLPDGYERGAQYVKDKLLFACNPQKPQDAIDQTLLHSFQMAEELRFSLQQEAAFMFESLLFDTRRRGNDHIYHEADLNEHFYRLDIVGTIQGTLKIFGEKREYMEELQPLGMATRKFYNMRDFQEDIADGMINISHEQMDELNILRKDLDDPDSPSVKMWFLTEAREGIKLILAHQKNLETMRTKLITNLALEKIFEQPALQFFHKTLQSPGSPS